jgi:hypothetical protein
MSWNKSPKTLIRICDSSRPQCACTASS